MRSRLVSLSLVLLASTVLGCATGSSSRATTGLFRKPTPTAENKAESTITNSDSVAKSDNPFRKSDAASDLKKSTEISKSSLQQTAAKEDSAKAAFPPATQQLINAELADAAPEEKADWLDRLQRVDPAMIPQILQTRRLSAQIVDQQQSGSTEESSSKTADGTPWADAEKKESNPSQVVQAIGRKFPGDKADLNTALHQTDGLSMRQQIVQQGYETPAAPPAGKPPFAVQRVSDTAPANVSAPPAALPNNLSARNALSRFLPSSRGGAVAAANSSSAVSLLPPVQTDRSGSYPAQLEPLIAAMESEVAQLQPGATEESQTEYIRRHVELRLFYLMANHPERALTAIPGVEPADQEFWQQTLWAMTNYFDQDHIPTAKDRAGQAVAQLTTATQRLREKADLEIRNLAFCQEIAYFGNFTRFPRDEFRPGDSALVYAEIENFKSELTIDGQYRTLLRSTLEILSPSGEVRWHKEFSATEDLCLNYRRDYFHNYQFTIPDRLPLGPHTLKLTVFDELSNKMVSQSINFIVR